MVLKVKVRVRARTAVRVHFLILEFGSDVYSRPYAKIYKLLSQVCFLLNVVVDVAMHLGMGVLLLSSISWCSVDMEESARPEWDRPHYPFSPQKAVILSYKGRCSGRRCWAGNAGRAPIQPPYKRRREGRECVAVYTLRVRREVRARQERVSNSHNIVLTFVCCILCVERVAHAVKPACYAIPTL